MDLLNDPKAIWRIDRSDMLGKAAALNLQCEQGWRLGLGFKLPKGWGRSRHLLVLGVGGSAIGGDLLKEAVAGSLSRPITVNRTYTIPAWVNRETLVVACSYSGNTEETLSATQAAADKGARILAFTSGGKLASWAKRHGFPLILIPPGLPPRAAIGYQLFGPLGFLVGLGWLKESSLPVEKACQSLEQFIEGKLHPSVGLASNPAKKLAGALQGRLPILYGASGGWEGVTYRWRTQLEENAKTLTFHHLFPEATHNEISGWLEPRSLMKELVALFLVDPAIHPRIRRRMEFTAGIIRRQGARVLHVETSGESTLARTLKLIALGDFVSVYLGILYRVDPTPVKRVEALKEYLKGG